MFALVVLAAATAALVGPAAGENGDWAPLAGQGPTETCKGGLVENPYKGPGRNDYVRGDFGDQPFGSAVFIDGTLTFSLAVTAGGRLYVAERSYVRDANGAVVGARFLVDGKPVTAGESVAASEAAIPGLTAIAIDGAGQNLYIAERSLDGAGGNVLRVNVTSPSPTVRLVAPITATPVDIAADQRGTVYVGANDGSVTRIDNAASTPTATRVPATVPGLNSVAVDAAGTRLFAASPARHTVSEIDLQSPGTAKVVAGTDGVGDTVGGSGDGGPAKDALLFRPRAVAVDPLGANLYIVDRTATGGTSRIRHVDLKKDSLITTVVGPDGTGLAAQLRFEGFDVAVDGGQNLRIADRDNCRIFLVEDPRKAPPTSLTTAPSTAPTTQGTVTTVATSTPVTFPNTVPATAPSSSGAGSDPTPVAANRSDVLVNPSVGSSTAGPTPDPNLAANPSALPSPVGTESAVAPAPPPAQAAPGPAVVVNPVPQPAAPVQAPASPPPPGPPQPAANNPGLVAAEDQAGRGAARYAMVRSDDAGAATGAAIMVAGAMAAVFVCVMLAAPKAAPKHRPRPKGAY